MKLEPFHNHAFVKHHALKKYQKPVIQQSHRIYLFLI